MTLTRNAARHVRRRIEGRDPAEACAALMADCLDAEKRMRAVAARMAALPEKVAPGATKEERRKTRDEIETEGKIAARKRAEQDGSPRCEWFTGGKRCASYGSDCDHVLSGSHKNEMEDLPNGEGFQVECRTHHALKHGPGKTGHLAQAKEHALRIRSKGLLRALAKATALHEGKHGRTA